MSNENEQLNGLIDASAKSGNIITLKMKNIRKHIRTGKTTKSIEIEDLELQMQNDDLFKTIPEKLIELLNQVK